MRVATFNIRNARSLDRKSLWWLRRRALTTVVDRIDADVWAMQEAYPSQVTWLDRTALGGSWERAGTGRNADGGGEGCPIWVRSGPLRIATATTRWYGGTPDEPGTRLPGARFPRIAVLARVESGGGSFVVVNTHLDEASADRRRASVEQLATWLADEHATEPAIVMGDFNCTLDDGTMDPLFSLGLHPLLRPADGPTANGFGRRDHQHQLDHVLVSERWLPASASVDRGAGYVSDHWPVVATLAS